MGMLSSARDLEARADKTSFYWHPQLFYEWWCNHNITKPAMRSDPLRRPGSDVGELGAICSRLVRRESLGLSRRQSARFPLLRAAHSNHVQIHLGRECKVLKR